MRLPIALPSGLRRDGTEGQSRGRWLRSNLVRGYGDDIGPVGGWRARSPNAVSGKARAIVTWSTDGAERRIGIGTHTGLYVQNSAGAVFDITPSAFVAGGADASFNTGFGGGPYGSGIYGAPRIDTGSPEPATVWTLDTWGSYLVGCCPSDGRLVQWENDTATDAAAITNAPTACLAILTTQDRFTVALGASGNPRSAAWCDRGDNEVWLPSTTNLAGDFELDSYGSIVCAVELRSLSLILTDADAHTMRYVGLPSVFVFERIGEGCGAVSAGCVATQGDFAMWWSKSGFMRFDGGLAAVDCPIRDLMANVNSAQISKCSAWSNVDHTEFVWCYPSVASVENDRYISFNYSTGEWWEGELARLSGAAKTVFAFPLLMDDNGLVHEHEVGSDYDGATPSARSGPYLLGDGSTVQRVLGIVPDVTGSPTIGFFTRDYPMAPETQVAQATLALGRTDLRFTARQVEINVEFTASTERFGKSWLEAVAGGRR